MIKLKIRKGDTVQVITGSDKGKKGEVLAVDPTGLKIKVQGVKVQTHFDKKEGLLKKEGFIDYLYFINLNIDLTFIKPEIKAHIQQNTDMMAKFIIQF